MDDTFRWCSVTENRLLVARSEGHTYARIADCLGTTASSVKHKARRLGQLGNEDRYKHTDEKRVQASLCLPVKINSVYETHCGFGGMTEFYAQMSPVLALDKDPIRTAAIGALGLNGVEVMLKDSERYTHTLVGEQRVFSVVDIDPYGYPSRYFPHVLLLLKDGVLFITFPKTGVAQMNKITVAHLDIFWGITATDTASGTIPKVLARLAEFAFMTKRKIALLDVLDLGRVYRLAIAVKAASLLDIVGLEVNRKKAKK